MRGFRNSRKRDAVMHDPLRSWGGLHEVSRLRRGIAEFLRLPLLITIGFTILGVVVAVADASAGSSGPLRRLAADVVPGGNARDFVGSVATTIVTVTSITFSVLLLAVQQTASALTAVIFDQFLRRRGNQLYFGSFVGLSAFCFVVYGMARSNPQPVYGGAITLVFVIFALILLLLLIHGTIDQMRPQSVVRSIHELALRARARELDLLCRTRESSVSEAGRPYREVTVEDSGYVVSVDVDRLARVAAAAGDEVEAVVNGTLGRYLIFGDTAVRLLGVDPGDDTWDDDARTAFALDDIRDVEAESGYALAQLENIAWASASSSQQSPENATTAIRALYDLLSRWLVAGERDRSVYTDTATELPVVYRDGVVHRILNALATLVVSSSESRQAQTCAELLSAFGGVAKRLRSEGDRIAFDNALDSVLPAVIQHAEVPALREALGTLSAVLVARGHEAGRVIEVSTLLADATQRLLPKPSDEPEAAHPRPDQRRFVNKGLGR